MKTNLTPQQREAILAAQLRENLKKRKAQAKARAQQNEDSLPPATKAVDKEPHVG